MMITNLFDRAVEVIYPGVGETPLESSTVMVGPKLRDIIQCTTCL